MKLTQKLKSWQWFVLLYLIGLAGISVIAYSLRFMIHNAL